MAEDIYGPSIPHLNFKRVWRNIQNVVHVKIIIVTKNILDKYKEATICCDLMHINEIRFLNTILQHVMRATGIMINNRKLRTLQM